MHEKLPDWDHVEALLASLGWNLSSFSRQLGIDPGTFRKWRSAPSTSTRRLRVLDALQANRLPGGVRRPTSEELANLLPERWVSVPRHADEILLELPHATPPADSLGDAFRLLNPAYRLVPFTGRRRECNELLEWTDRPEPMLVHVITGAGGTGKTRLGMEVAALRHLPANRDEMASWQAGFLRTEKLPSSLDFSCDALIIVDYASTELGLITSIVQAHVGRAAQHRVRILLLDRTWTPYKFSHPGLTSTARHYLNSAPVLALDEREREDAEVHALYRNALTAFQSQPLSLDRVQGRLGITSNDLYRLSSLATVFAALSDTYGGRIPDNPLSLDDLVTPLLELHEVNYWHRHFYDLNVRYDHPMWISGIVNLAGRAKTGQLTELLTALPGLEDAGLRRSLAEWAIRTHPGSDLGHAYPNALDPVAEVIVARTLREHPNPHAVLDKIGGGTPAMRERLLTILTLGASTRPDVRALLSEHLNRNAVLYLDEVHSPEVST